MQRSCLKTYISYRFDADDANDTDLRRNNPCHPRHRASENNQPIILFPLNGRIGLRRHVITNTVYILHLLENTVGNLHQYRPLYRLNSSSHGIHRINGTDNDRPVKRTGIITYTYRLEIGYNSEILPYFLIQTCQPEFFLQDSVRLTNSLQTVTCDSSQATYPPILVRGKADDTPFHTANQVQDHTHALRP